MTIWAPMVYTHGTIVSCLVHLQVRRSTFAFDISVVLPTVAVSHAYTGDVSSCQKHIRYKHEAEQLSVQCSPRGAGVYIIGGMVYIIGGMVYIIGGMVYIIGGMLYVSGDHGCGLAFGLGTEPRWERRTRRPLKRVRERDRTARATPPPRNRGVTVVARVALVSLSEVRVCDPRARPSTPEPNSDSPRAGCRTLSSSSILSSDKPVPKPKRALALFS